MKTGICLNMIIKNEAKNLPRLFQSLHKVIDYYVISDTGSTDNSVEIIKELGAKYHIDGIIESHPWHDFATNRNIALNMAIKALHEQKHQCKWWLVFDPDEELIIEDQSFYTKLNENYSYCISKEYNNIHSAPLLLLSFKQKDWQWQGAIHNFLDNKSDHKKSKLAEGISIKCHVFEGAKSKAFANQKEKSLKDIELLETELQNSIPSPDNIHRYFSLANEYHEATNYSKATEIFNLILSQANPSQKTFIYFTHIQLGNIYFEIFHREEKAIYHYEKAIETNNKRKEAYYFMAKINMLKKDYVQAEKYLQKAIQITSVPQGEMYYLDIYRWKIEYDLILTTIHLNKTNEAKSMFQLMKSNQFLPTNRLKLLDTLLLKIESKR